MATTLCLAIPVDEASDLGVGDFSGIHGHLASELRAPPARVPAVRRGRPRVRRARLHPGPRSFRSASAVRQAVFATVGVGSDPPHLASEQRPERAARPLDPIKIEQGRRGARQAAGERAAPTTAAAARTLFCRLGKSRQASSSLEQRDVEPSALVGGEPLDLGSATVRVSAERRRRAGKKRAETHEPRSGTARDLEDD